MKMTSFPCGPASRRAAFLISILVLCARGASAQHVHAPRDEALPVVRVERDEEKRELVFTLGPLDLPAGASHHALPQPGAHEAIVPIDGWLHGYRVRLLDARGQPVPQAVLHHLNIISRERRELFSPIMQRVGAAAEETPPVTTPGIVGYRVRKGDRLLLKAMLHNPTAQNYPGTRLELRMRYTTTAALLRPFSIYPFYVDVMPPAGIHAFDLPPGRSSRRWEGRPALSGRILALGGHLHTYGERLRFEDVTAGKVIWEGRPPVDPAGAITGMPTRTYFWRLGLPIHADHTYRLTAFYDNPTGKVIPAGGMGTLGGVFLPGFGRPWPDIDPQDPQYQKDIRVTVHDEDSPHASQQGLHAH